MMNKWWMDGKKIDVDEIARIDEEKEERRIAFMARETKEARTRAREKAEYWDKFTYSKKAKK